MRYHAPCRCSLVPEMPTISPATWDAYQTARTRDQFEDIVENFTVLDERTRPENDRITVLLELPHLKDYGRDPVVQLVYGCRFPVQVGDLVRCPPTPLYSKWTTGQVVSLDGGQYRGPVKQVKPTKEGTP